MRIRKWRKELADTAFISFKKNVKDIFFWNIAADVFITVENGRMHATIAVETKTTKIDAHD